jgi:hypothetical protein
MTQHKRDKEIGAAIGWQWIGGGKNGAHLLF